MKLTKAIQAFKRETITDVQKTVRDEIKRSGLTFPKGASIAVTAGSRGVANIALIIKGICDEIKEMGGAPFIIPAMGSHGGATPEGQRKVLESYGVTEGFVGAPIRSSLDVAELDGEGLGCRLFMDKYAYNAHGVVLVNRVKVHTDYHGPFESGLLKMCIIGLGKHAQALEIHSFGTKGLRDMMPQAARRIISSGRILLGVGISENAYEETARIRAALPGDIEKTETEMLAWNRLNMPSLPADDIDVLMVDRLGKDISGAGMDTNIIGRMRIRGEAEPEKPRVKIIIADDLTEAAHGNAAGMGLADLITERLRDKIDFDATYENTLTSSFTMRGSMPIVCKNASEALRQALRACGEGGVDKPRVMRIRDTLRLDEVYLSDALLKEAENLPHVTITSEVIDAFDGNGCMTPWE